LKGSFTLPLHGKICLLSEGRTPEEDSRECSGAHPLHKKMTAESIKEKASVPKTSNCLTQKMLQKNSPMTPTAFAKGN
ncbi:hypothetical protein MUP38_04340, partial [Candidatus Bathyarchaeota archaeon]|nr:hypothetical protein [Candidatus Bathyarchaeota archaeon]